MTSSNFSIGKTSAAHHATEMISFLWELIQCNKRFRRYLCETKVGMDYLVILLFYARDSVGDEMKQGLMRMAIFVIQSLSVEAAFNAKLNTPFLHVGSLPPVMRVENFHGSYADFLICVRLSSIVPVRDDPLLISVKSIHSLITMSHGRLEPVYPALFNIIKNVTPYAKNLQRATSSKVMNLFEIVSAPSFCLKNDSNHLILKSLLEGCNALLENHLRGKFRSSISCPSLPMLVQPMYSRPQKLASTSDLSKFAWRRPSWISGSAVMEGYGRPKSSHVRKQTDSVFYFDVDDL